jgi:hypothetical protein
MENQSKTAFLEAVQEVELATMMTYDDLHPSKIVYAKDTKGHLGKD